jgi:hypothetical protein
VAFYYETTPDGVGLTPNPEGYDFTDYGLGTFLRSGFGSAPNPNSTWTKYASVSDGKMQTSTARNVALTPRKCPTTEAPGPYFQKEFFHNGYIKSLKQLVHFWQPRFLPELPRQRMLRMSSRRIATCGPACAFLRLRHLPIWAQCPSLAPRFFGDDSFTDERRLALLPGSAPR